MPLPTLVGRATEEGLPTASSVAAGTESAATTCGDSAVVPGSAAGVVADADPPVPAVPPAVRCEEAAADGLPFPAALITTMVATAAITSPTGTSAVRTGCRVRNRPARCGGTAVDDLVVVALRSVLRFVVVVDLVVGRGRRDGPDGDFDMLFSLDWAEGRQRRRALGSSRWRPRRGLPVCCTCRARRAHTPEREVRSGAAAQRGVELGELRRVEQGVACACRAG